VLADVHRPGAHVHQAFDLGLLVVRAQIDVQPVLHRLGLRYRGEQQARHLLGAAPDLDLVRRLVHDPVAQRLGPPAGQPGRIFGIHDDLLPVAAHTSPPKAHRK
jgi:hypothetical protein